MSAWVGFVVCVHYAIKKEKKSLLISFYRLDHPCKQQTQYEAFDDDRDGDYLLDRHQMKWSVFVFCSREKFIAHSKCHHRISKTQSLSRNETKKTLCS